MQFDKVLVDVPCSGTGVLSKRADLRWQRDESSLAELRLLQVCASCVCNCTTPCFKATLYKHGEHSPPSCSLHTL